MQFMVFPRLAELLGAPSLSAQGRRPLTSIFDSAVVRDVASEAKGILEPLRDHPSTHLSLRQTFRQMRHATDAALDNLAAQGGLRAETVALFRRYRERIRDYYDDEDLAEAAAAAVRNDDAPGLKDLGFIVFFRVRGLTPAQRILAHALAEDGRCAMLLGKTGDEQADQSTHALAGDLRPVLSEPQTPADAQSNAPTESPHILIAPDAHQELRWVIRRIMQRAQSGTPFHRMAVLYRKEAPYGTLIREELTLANIPRRRPESRIARRYRGGQHAPRTAEPSRRRLRARRCNGMAHRLPAQAAARHRRCILQPDSVGYRIEARECGSWVCAMGTTPKSVRR